MLALVVTVILLGPRTVYGDGCLTTQSDPGALNIIQLREATTDQQLRQSIAKAECVLLDNITYSDSNPDDNAVFDFIVLGAGSGGSVAANRLTENGKWKVLVLEAGGDPTITSEMPALYAATWNSEIDWKYLTEPDPACCQGSVNQRCTWPRGKVVGGSSAINGMLYVRGNPLDFYGWWENGNPGWKYDDLLPYFKKSEDMRSETVSSNHNFLEYHNKGGLLKVESFMNDITFFRDRFSKAFKEMGYNTYNDVNADQHEGLFLLQGTLDKARRCSSASAFLRQFYSRPNLKLSKNSMVTKILIDKTKKAYGVMFTKGGKTFTVKAIKEVIVCAGSVNTPQLLMLSGIGPKEHLKEFGIDVIQNLKVGHNLQDHIGNRGILISMNTSLTSTPTNQSTLEFLKYSNGSLSGIGISNIGGFTKSSTAAYPNLQYYFAVFPAKSSDGFRQLLTAIGYTKDIQDSMIKINEKKDTLLLIPSLLRPKSRGKILLASKNPLVYPRIQPAYLSDEQDVEDNLDAIDFAEKFTKTEAMQGLEAKIEPIDIPGCRDYKYPSQDYWRCVLKYMIVTVYHPVGTCQMGPQSKGDTVVDHRLKVHGINGLRLMDASIMPTVPSANTESAVLAIAEKGSDMIKEDWKKEM